METSKVPCATYLSTVSVWHERLCHVSNSIVNTVLHKNGIDVIKSLSSSICESYELEKSHKLSFLVDKYVISSSPFELLYIDIWWPSTIVSTTGKCYFLLIVNDFNHFS